MSEIETADGKPVPQAVSADSAWEQLQVDAPRDVSSYERAEMAVHGLRVALDGLKDAFPARANLVGSGYEVAAALDVITNLLQVLEADQQCERSGAAAPLSHVSPEWDRGETLDAVRAYLAHLPPSGPYWQRFLWRLLFPVRH